jgi:hypothetical protein
MKLNKDIKILRFGKCYINRTGDFVITLLNGNKKYGYTFIASHANPSVWLGKIYMMSRTIPNDGNWTEIDKNGFNFVSVGHASGYVVQLPVFTGKDLPIISKKYGETNCLPIFDN